MEIKTIGYWIMIIFVVCLCIYLIYYVNTESSKCLVSPLTYGANQIKTDDGNSIKCSCFANGINANIFFDNNSITYDYTRTTSIQ